MNKHPKFETGNVGVQFIGKPRPANTDDEILKKMVNSSFAEHKNNAETANNRE